MSARLATLPEHFVALQSVRERLGPLARGVEHAQDLNAILAEAIRNDIWELGDNQLARVGNPARTTQTRMSGESIDRLLNPFDDAVGSRRIVLSNVFGDGKKVAPGRLGPLDVHRRLLLALAILARTSFIT